MRPEPSVYKPLQSSTRALLKTLTRSGCCAKVLQNMGLILTQSDTFYYLPAIPFFSYFGNGVLARNLQKQIYVKFKAKVVELIRS